MITVVKNMITVVKDMITVLICFLFYCKKEGILDSTNCII